MVGVLRPFSAHVQILVIIVEKLVVLGPEERPIDDAYVLGRHHYWVETLVVSSLGHRVAESTGPVPSFHALRIVIAHDVDDIFQCLSNVIISFNSATFLLTESALCWKQYEFPLSMNITISLFG